MEKTKKENNTPSNNELPGENIKYNLNDLFSFLKFFAGLIVIFSLVGLYDEKPIIFWIIIVGLVVLGLIIGLIYLIIKKTKIAIALILLGILICLIVLIAR